MLRPALLVAIAVVAGCKSPRRAPDDAPPAPAVPRGAAPAAPPIDAAARWPELAGDTIIAPVRVIALPTRGDRPRFEVGGPVLVGDVAVVASSQFGFLAVDWRGGTIAWSKPAGEHVAPPAPIHGGVALIGGCATPPEVPDGEQLVGCLRMVSPAGADLAYLAIRGKPAAVAPFLAARGAQHVWPDAAARAIRWRRGDQAIRIDVGSGAARPVDPTPPPLVIEHAGARWEIHHDAGKLVARGAHPWSTERTYTALIGAVHLPGRPPALRVANLGAFGDDGPRDGPQDGPQIDVIDLDATGARPAQAAARAPGIGLLGWGTSPVGDTALAVRLDRSLRRDAIVGYAANARRTWVYPLPEVTRVDPVGVAIAPDAVVVFHDGDTVTVLPQLSAPPTSPAAPPRPSRNPTP